jgi:hypothetical protein
MPVQLIWGGHSELKARGSGTSSDITPVAISWRVCDYKASGAVGFFSNTVHNEIGALYVYDYLQANVEVTLFHSSPLSPFMFTDTY